MYASLIRTPVILATRIQPVMANYSLQTWLLVNNPSVIVNYTSLASTFVACQLQFPTGGLETSIVLREAQRVALLSNN